jgi:hypothetical protein
VEAFWGTDRWTDLIKDIPVKELEFFNIEEDIPPGIGDRIDLSRDIED